jgi:hypothetical protein
LPDRLVCLIVLARGAAHPGIRRDSVAGEARGIAAAPLTRSIFARFTSGLRPFSISRQHQADGCFAD